MLSRSLSVAVLVLAVACGDDGQSVTADAAIDGRPDAVPSGCDYTESSDLTNDTLAAGGVAEDTGISFVDRAVVCGTFDHTHFDGDITVDIDAYTITVGVTTDVLVRIKGQGAAAIELVGVDIYGGANLTTLVGVLTFYGNHGVTAVRLEPGTYELLAFALSSAPITQPVAYRLEVVSDSPEVRCPEVTSGGYTEANDGATNSGNDVVRLPSGQPPSLTPLTTDNPEPTGIVLASGLNIRIAGNAADIPNPDLYEDKDTYAFATGPMANEMTVRLTWSGTGSNLDFILFEAGDPQPIVRGNSTSQAGLELDTFAVKPSRDYWLLVGARAGTTVPVAYNATLCGASFTP
jgi:hypothetical protein